MFIFYKVNVQITFRLYEFDLIFRMIYDLFTLITNIKPCRYFNQFRFSLLLF